jgi:hypothetical protein
LTDFSCAQRQLTEALNQRNDLNHAAVPKLSSETRPVRQAFVTEAGL